MSVISVNKNSTSTFFTTTDITNQSIVLEIGSLTNVNTAGLAEGVFLRYDDTNDEFVVTDEIDGGTY